MTPRPGGPETGPGGLGSAVVIGTGLIGTSIALALCEQGVTVWLTDHDPAAARLAAELGAGKILPEPLGAVERGEDAPEAAAPGQRPQAQEGPWADLAVLAVPPAAVASSLAAAQARRLARWYTDVASVKALPLRQASELGCDLACFVPGHPLSGRERSGPAAARADLFLGRPWVICPGPLARPEAIVAVADLVRCCRGELVQADADEHDHWVALVSHAPHVVAAAMAAQLTDAPGGALGLAGQGLRDVTRIAAGDAGLWTQILAANAALVARVLADVAADLAAVAEALAEAGVPQHSADHPSVKLLAGLLEEGSAGVGTYSSAPDTSSPEEPSAASASAMVIPSAPGPPADPARRDQPGPPCARPVPGPGRRSGRSPYPG